MEGEPRFQKRMQTAVSLPRWHSVHPAGAFFTTGSLPLARQSLLSEGMKRLFVFLFNGVVTR